MFININLIVPPFKWIAFIQRKLLFVVSIFFPLKMPSRYIIDMLH